MSDTNRLEIELTAQKNADGEAAPSNGRALSPTNGTPGRRRRRATAESMAASQRDISVSEFFAKNRHLLGFDNPRKALLTTVKEAVDNALDACEEAGILPEIWVHIEPTGQNRYKVGVQDNGPGIVKKQIPLIFGKLLYGSKFHRLRMSRGQQGIGISAAGMYGVLTTGKPVKIISKVSAPQAGPLLRNPDRHQAEPAGDPQRQGRRRRHSARRSGREGHREARHRVDRVGPRHAGDDRAGGQVTSAAAAASTSISSRRRSPTRTSRSTTPIPRATQRTTPRVADELPPEPKEIKPHPYGVELGRLVGMLKDTKAPTVVAVPDRVVLAGQLRPWPGGSATTAKRQHAGAARARSAGTRPTRSTRRSRRRRSAPPATDCISPIGEELILKGLHQVVPGEFYAAATRPPAVYRGNPFQIEVGLAYGGGSAAQRVTPRGAGRDCSSESDARTLRQFLATTFDGLGADAADKILKEAEHADPRSRPASSSAKEIDQLHEAMQNVNLAEGQTMNVLRYANRVPLQFQAGGLRDHADGHGDELAVATA